MHQIKRDYQYRTSDLESKCVIIIRDIENKKGELKAPLFVYIDDLNFHKTNITNNMFLTVQYENIAH